MPILEVKGLVKYYGRRKVVGGVNFDVEVGEIVGLLGPNGAGKTTSFRMTTGQITPNEGKVLFNGQDVSQLPMYKRARLGLGYLADGYTASSIISAGAGGGGKSVVLRLVVEPFILGVGLAFALVMGAVGGLLPSLSAMRVRPLESLR